MLQNDTQMSGLQQLMRHTQLAHCHTRLSFRLRKSSSDHLSRAHATQSAGHQPHEAHNVSDGLLPTRQHKHSNKAKAAQAPYVDYHQLLSRHEQGCPALFLAPMENLADRPARVALKDSIGCFDEACTEFIRVPRNSDHPAATTRGITAAYDACELGAIPLAAQLMGSNTALLAAAAERLALVKQAPRIDINCGCPANVVTGGGAGSSLLKDPEQLLQVVSAVVAAVGQRVPVTVKMRSGFDDTTLFQENLMAVQEAGAAFVTIHPRTKQQSYNGTANWDLIALAKQLLSIPVVGNGDIVSVESALAMLQHTACDGLMIGRGALQDPLLFYRIKSHFSSAQTNSQQQLAANAAAAASAAAQAAQAAASYSCNQQAVMNWQQQQQQQQQHPSPPLQQLLPDQAAQQQQLQQQLGVVDALAPHLQSVLQQPGGEALVVEDFLRRYASYGLDGTAGGAGSLHQSGQIGRLKKVMKYVFSGQPQLREACSQLLRAQPGKITADLLLELIVQQVHLHWREGGPPEQVLVSHYTMPGRGISKADQLWQITHQKVPLHAASKV